MAQSTLIKIFVYGTLKRNQPNHSYLMDIRNGRAKFLSSGFTEEKYPLVIGTRWNIPFLLNRKGIGHHVQGEVYDVDDNMLAKLDILEGYPNYYDRRLENINSDNRIIPCWLYMIRNFPDKLLSKEHLPVYEDSKEHPYCPRLQRFANFTAKDDMDF